MSNLTVEQNANSVTGTAEGIALWRLDQIVAQGGRFVDVMERVQLDIRRLTADSVNATRAANNGLKEWCVNETRVTYEQIATLTRRYSELETAVRAMVRRQEADHATLLARLNEIDGARQASRKRVSARVASSTKKAKAKKTKRASKPVTKRKRG